MSVAEAVAADAAAGRTEAVAYNERIIRYFVIATVFWGVAAFVMGVFIAF